MTRVALLAGCLAALTLAGPPAAPLHAQEDDLARVRRDYDAATVERLEALIAEAQEDGVPRTLLVERVLYGAAQGVGSDVLLAAVDSWADDLRAAVALLPEETSPSGIAKAAESIRHGVSPDVVRDLALRHPADFPIMLQVIEDLVHVGVQLDEAEEIVAEASERGLEGQDVLTLSAGVRRLVREGTSPVEAASSMRQSVRTGRSVIPPPSPMPRPTRLLRGRRSGIPPF